MFFMTLFFEINKKISFIVSVFLKKAQKKSDFWLIPLMSPPAAASPSGAEVNNSHQPSATTSTIASPSPVASFCFLRCSSFSLSLFFVSFYPRDSGFFLRRRHPKKVQEAFFINKKRQQQNSWKFQFFLKGWDISLFRIQGETMRKGQWWSGWWKHPKQQRRRKKWNYICDKKIKESRNQKGRDGGR